MISIVMAMRSLWACKILNREKKIEVRKGLALYNVLKKAEEKGEEVEFLMYVTKAKPYLDYIEEYDEGGVRVFEAEYVLKHDGSFASGLNVNLNGKVVAKFKAKAFMVKHQNRRNFDDYEGYYLHNGEKMDIGEIALCELSCLNHKQLDDYLQGKESTALHIRNLEPLPEPKTLADYGLKRAPQSWCYAKEAL